jgi:hypothetical protein
MVLAVKFGKQQWQLFCFKMIDLFLIDNLLLVLFIYFFIYDYDIHHDRNYWKKNIKMVSKWLLNFSERIKQQFGLFNMFIYLFNCFVYFEHFIFQ